MPAANCGVAIHARQHEHGAHLNQTVIAMQSYAAARSLFSFMSFVAWSAIIGGGIVALVAMGAVMQFNGSAPAIISAALPGLVICLFGFLALVMVQIGRATLDSAEYGQQSLQVARDQLAFAKQVHLETNSGNMLISAEK